MPGAMPLVSQPGAKNRHGKVEIDSAARILRVVT